MRAFFAGLSLLTLAACGSSGTGPDGGAVIGGVYTLTAADNKPLPAVFTDSTLKSGTLTVTDSGWTQLIIVLYAAGGNPAGDTLTQGGSWVTNGSNLTLYDYSNTTAYTGSFTPTSITLNTKTSTVLSYTK